LYRIGSRDLNIPHINCESHLLANQFKKWLVDTSGDEGPNSRTFGPGTVLELVNNTMKEFRGNVNGAILRQHTELKPKTKAVTRWTSGYDVLDQHEKMEKAIKLASQDDGADIMLPPGTNHFELALKRTLKQFKDVNAVVIRLQESGLTLLECRHLLERLIGYIAMYRGVQNNHWYCSTFGKEYIASDSEKRPDVLFANAVCKMQARQGNSLTAAECGEISKWVKKNATTAVVRNNMSLADQLKQPKGEKRAAEKVFGDGDDSCLDHVIGSAAVVERLWLQARYIITTLKSNMTPYMLETILFLQCNRAMWCEKLVQAARAAVKAEQKSERLTEKMRQANEQRNEGDDVFQGVEVDEHEHDGSDDKANE
jgi:hypothetical protein